MSFLQRAFFLHNAVKKLQLYTIPFVILPAIYKAWKSYESYQFHEGSHIMLLELN